jgi:hypothetical protein
MNLTPWAANAILNGTAMPATLWVQLHTGNPGTNGTANVAADDRRRSFTRTTATGGTCSNAALIEWLSAPATEDLTHISIHDASTAGNAWWVGEINDAPVSAVAGQATEIALGDLTLTLAVWS